MGILSGTVKVISLPPKEPIGMMYEYPFYWPSRWTSNRNGSVKGVYPTAGGAEKLDPHGQGHKITQLSPSLYSEAGKAVAIEELGNTIFVD